MRKNCEYCGIEYNAKRSSSKYCSRDCQIKARTKRVTVQCDYCGKDIEKKQCHMNHEHHFCDKVCQGKWTSLNKVGENHPSYSRVEVKCDTCGKIFAVENYKKDNETHYCSRECQHKSLIGKSPSEETRQKLRDSVPRGENSPHWNHGKTAEEREIERRYPEYHQWKVQVKERDNYTCQCCGKRGGELHSHHKDGYHWCKERRTDVSNGATLCKHCHDKFHDIYGHNNNTEQQFNEFISNMLIPR